MDELQQEGESLEHQFESRIDLSPLNSAISNIKHEIGKVIVGQKETIDLVLAAILSDGHILLEGVPGIAKTLLTRLVAKTISVDFSRIQFTPDLMPSDILGTSIYNASKGDFSFRKGPIFSNIVLIDEVNRSPAKTQAALFEVMEERQITNDGTTYPMDVPFLVMATQNPVEQEGTYQLPEAQLDRFLFKIEMSYPQPEEETEILRQFHLKENKVDISTVQAVISKDDLVQYRGLIGKVRAEEKLLKYIADLVVETRNNRDIFLGASPRASLAILSGSKAIAAMDGRDFITPEDVKYVLPHALKHRIIISPEREMEGSSTADVIAEIANKVEVPR
ncbi:MAG: MoxR family ATPase [Saprospiraceae bacterium]|nr:MoxR family ATPase [Saprospiraceae bacterium]